jgi:ribosomal protein S18 acetylase RimI-like enzyme
VIREATTADHYGVQRIAEQAFAPFVAAIGKKPEPMTADFAALIDKGLVEVSVSNKGVNGYCVSYPKGAGWHIENLAVAPTLQGGGIGRALVADVEKRASSQGFETVDLYTNIAMEQALAFYPRLGYVELYRATEDGFERAYFRKNLS